MSRCGASTMPSGIGMLRLAHPDSSCRVSAAVVATVSAFSESGLVELDEPAMEALTPRSIAAPTPPE